jgi:hypothetical protein
LRLTRILLLNTSLLLTQLAALPPITLSGRLPGEHFKEDNPPRYGAITSLVSTSDSVVMLHAQPAAVDFTIADQIKKILRAFKIQQNNLEKLSIIEGEMRWLEYTFRKANGGGFLYITREGNWIIYLLVFNLSYDALFNDLPHILRYVRLLSTKGVKAG